MKCATLKPTFASYNQATNAVMDLLDNKAFIQADPKTKKEIGATTYQELKSQRYTHVQLFYRTNQHIILGI